MPKSSMICGGFFDQAGKQQQLTDIEKNLARCWDEPAVAAKLLKQKKLLDNQLTKLDNLQKIYDDLTTACDLAFESEDFIAEAGQLLVTFQKAVHALEVDSLLSGQNDDCDAIVTINAGAGGTESCDWVAMLLRMYLRFAERQGFAGEVFDLLDGDGAGIKNVTFEVRGLHAYGLLKAEIGVHRLVRISPFDANARRHTSFASVAVSASVDEDFAVTINPTEVRIDTYRASGAGGQHVNRTDSAVRITHFPSGIVVQCQTQRSQHQNKEQAFKILKSRLYEKHLQEKQRQSTQQQKSTISWGSQIRSYILHPYKLVKDHRTGFEHHTPDTVLDGAIEEFIYNFLGHRPQD